MTGHRLPVVPFILGVVPVSVGLFVALDAMTPDSAWTRGGIAAMITYAVLLLGYGFASGVYRPLGGHAVLYSRIATAVGLIVLLLGFLFVALTGSSLHSSALVGAGFGSAFVGISGTEIARRSLTSKREDSS